MTNYDKKRLEMMHDGVEAVTFTVEVDFTNTGEWRPCATVAAGAGKRTLLDFPDGFGAYWVRVTSDKACRATATFFYE
jgi:hypothetical protein